MTSVVICDKAGPARDALANRVSQVRPVEAVRSASNPAELIEMLNGVTVDAVLVGSSLDAGHPSDMVRLVRAAQPGARVYATTLGTDPEAIIEAIEAGAHGYVAADASVPELSALLAHTDRIAVPSDAETAIPQRETVSLTDRERQVLEGMSRGRSNSHRQTGQ